MKAKVFWRQNGTFSKNQNPNNIHQSQTTILCHLRTLRNTNFYQIFCSFICQEDSYYSDILLPRGKFLAPKWYHGINNTKVVIYLDKINKSPLSIYRYINRTCLKQKNWKKSYMYTIYNTNYRKNTTFRKAFTTVKSIIAKFRNGWLSKYTNGQFTTSKENLSDNIQSGWSFKISFTRRIWEMH